MIVEVFLAKSLICFLGQCSPALVGERTPVGTFQMERIKIKAPQYGGSVLKFAPDGRDAIFAVHRPPSQRRRILLDRPERPHVTMGCINVKDEVYEALPDTATLRILP